MNIKMEKFEYNHTIQLGGEVFHVREMLPRLEKEQMA